MEILNILDIGSPAVKTLKSFSFFEEKKYIYSLAGRKCFIYSHGKITILAKASCQKNEYFTVRLTVRGGGQPRRP